MKFLLFLLLLGQTSFAQSQIIQPHRFGGITYLLQENFEGTGYENSWTEAGTGTIDKDYTGTVLEGSQSLRINLSSQSGRTTNTLSVDQAIIEAYFLFRPVAIPSGQRQIWASKDSGGNYMGELQINASGALIAQAGGGSTATTTGTLSAGTTYHVWVRVATGTGANGVCSVGFSTDGTRPTSGNNYKSSSNGTRTTSNHFTIFGSYAAATTTFEWIFDKYRITDGTTIGDNPS